MCSWSRDFITFNYFLRITVSFLFSFLSLSLLNNPVDLTITQSAGERFFMVVLLQNMCFMTGDKTTQRDVLFLHYLHYYTYICPDFLPCHFSHPHYFFLLSPYFFQIAGMTTAKKFYINSRSAALLVLHELHSEYGYSWKLLHFKVWDRGQPTY